MSDDQSQPWHDRGPELSVEGSKYVAMCYEFHNKVEKVRNTMQDKLDSEALRAEQAANLLRKEYTKELYNKEARLVSRPASKQSIYCVCSKNIY